MSWEILQADCIEAMRQMDEASVDAIVTDPPYGLEFMGKEWDRLEAPGAVIRDPATERGGFQDGNGGNPYSRSRIEYGRDPAKQQEWHQAWATEALRVLKPGGHLLAFGGTRTYHRLACAIEDAGFEIRDCLAYMYGSGFPKSLNVGKAIDKAAGAEREVVGTEQNWGASKLEDGKTGYGDYAGEWDKTKPATPEAAQWEGWGTALKPAHEPIVLARKPLIGTVASNCLEWGTGALNIDGCRIEGTVQAGAGSTGFGADREDDYELGTGREYQSNGRWPANVVLSHLPECEVVGTRKVKGTAHYKPGSEQQYESQGLYGVEGHVGASPSNPDGTETITAWECAEGCPVAMLDEQSGELGVATTGVKTVSHESNIKAGLGSVAGTVGGYGDSGGASRFFYTSKASRGERNAGLDGFEERDGAAIRPRERECKVCGNRSKWKGRWPNCDHDDWIWVEDNVAGDTEGRHKGALRNAHPT